MNINKSIIDQRITKIVADNPAWFPESSEDRKVSKAFLMVGVAAYLEVELAEAYTYITDDGHDVGVDAVYIGNATEADFSVVLFQSKYYRGKKMENEVNFEENAIIKMLYALKVIFDNERNVTLNSQLSRKIAEIQTLAYDSFLIPQVKCVMLSNGITWNNIAQQKIDNYLLENKYTEFDFFNHDGILNYIQSNKSIKADLKLNGKALKEELPHTYIRVLVGKMNVTEISRLFELHGDNLLERNIRKYLGINKNRINLQIKETLLSDKNENFYLYNNGITMICGKFRDNGFATDWIVKTEDLQVINGGQTCKTIQHTLRENPDTDFSKAYIMFRLYEIDREEEQIITDITISTNSQSPVDLRDLKANDLQQKKLETAIADLGYVYKRKRENIFQQSDSIASSVAAEAILTIWRECPHLAKYKRADLFGKFYERIFAEINACQVIIAVLIFRFCDNQRRRENLIQLHPHLPYSNYVMAMLMGKLLLTENHLSLSQLTHKNFQVIRIYFENNKENLFEKGNRAIEVVLRNEHGENYKTTELRKLAATFRKNETIVNALASL